MQFVEAGGFDGVGDGDGRGRGFGRRGFAGRIQTVEEVGADFA